MDQVLGAADMEDEENDSSFGGAANSSSSSSKEEQEDEDVAQMEREANGRAKKHVHVGKSFQADVPRVGARPRWPAPSVGEEVWRGTRGAVAGLSEWLVEVCDEVRAARGERGRVHEHCLQVLHAWDYDLRSLKGHWRRVCQLRPLPSLGPARWSRDDTFALEQIKHWYPGHQQQVDVGASALTAHTRGEVSERIFWLIGERSVSRPRLYLRRQRQQEEEPAEEEEQHEPEQEPEPAAERRENGGEAKEKEEEEEDKDGDEPMPLAPRVASSLAMAAAASPSAPAPPPPFHANLVGLSPAEKKRKMSATLPLIFSRIQEHNRSL
jgi:hypothetical protein